jgi:ketosteroid isomerase-like protein
MSANLNLVRSIYADSERGDYGSAEWAHPEIEYVWVDGPSPGHWTGLAAMAEAWRDVLNACRDFHAEVEEYRELDEDRVAVLLRFRGRGRTSGVSLEELRTRGASVYQIRNGKVTRIVSCFDRDRSLADLGLSPLMDWWTTTMESLPARSRKCNTELERRSRAWAGCVDRGATLIILRWRR